MDVRELQNHLKTLAALQETPAPLISCYLDIGNLIATYRSAFDHRIQILSRSVPAAGLPDFAAAVARIDQFLQSTLEPGTRGVAIFSRAGNRPFFCALQFHVPLPNWIVIGTTPNLYHLVELRDNYDRYVILIAGESSARIIAVNLGGIGEQIWNVRPELRRRSGREWGRDDLKHYEFERSQQFIHEQIRVLDRLINAGGYAHLVVAGNPRATAAVRRSLPKSLASKLVDIVPASCGDRLSDIVQSTLRTFLQHEELESRAIADKLVSRIHAHGLAVAGTGPTLKALRNAQGDFLVILKSYNPGLARECRRCLHLESETSGPLLCRSCGSDSLRELDLRAEMVRLAEISRCRIEVVEKSDVLWALGGVGCLLRFTPEALAPLAA